MDHTDHKRLIEAVQTAKGRREAFEVATAQNPTPSLRDGGATAERWERENRWCNPVSLSKALMDCLDDNGIGTGPASVRAPYTA